MSAQLTQETWELVMSLVYAVNRVSDPMSVMDELVGMSIGDLASKFCRADRIAQLDEALQSHEDLSRLGGVPRHTNEIVRVMLAELSRRIASEETPRVVKLDPDAKLREPIAAQIVFILTPLVETGNEDQAVRKLSTELSGYWTANDRYYELGEHLVSIRFALKSNVVLSKLTDERFAENVVRSYLRRAAVLFQAELSGS